MSRQAATPAQDERSLLVRIGSFFFYSRNQLFAAIVLVLLLAFRPVYLAGSEVADRWLDVLGVLVAVSGQALRGLVIGTEYIQRGGKNKKVYADDLVTGGLFGHSRNPLYVGNLLIYFGLFLIHNSPWVYLLGVPFFLFAYRAIVATEEDYLQRKFGETYQEYCRSVPRWLPRLRGLRQTLSAGRFDWLKVLRKDYTQIATCLGGCVALLAYETLVHHTYQQAHAYLNTLAACMVVLAVCWVFLLYAKVTGRLG